MSKFDRLLLILQLIRARKNLSAKGLAEEVGVSERTIYRDIKSLAVGAKIPVYYDKGFKLLDESFLPTLNFNLDELLTLWVGLRSEPVISNDLLVRVAKSLLIKIESQLPESVRQSFYKLRELVKVQSNVETSTKEALMWQVLKQALAEGKLINLVYEKVGLKNESYNEVKPKVLVWAHNKWDLQTIWSGKEKIFQLGKMIRISLLQ